MKKVLVFAPDSIHSYKFIQMIKDDVDVLLVTDVCERDYGVETIHLKRGLNMIFDIKKIIDKFDPDFIHIHTINRVAPFVFFWGQSHAKMILSAWGSSVLVIPKISWFHKKLAQYCLNKSDVVTFDANIEKYAIHDLVGKDKETRNINFGMIPYITDIKFEDKENIIYSPRSHADIYNIGKVIKSFAKFFKAGHEDWRLVLSGVEHPINTPRYKKLVKELEIENAVTFAGFLSAEQNAEYQAKAKIVVSIPFSDGKSHCLMEALYANNVCFVSDLPSNYEMVSDKVNGFIVDDHELINFATYELIDNDLMKAYNAKKLPEFSYEENAKKFIKLYQ